MGRVGMRCHYRVPRGARRRVPGDRRPGVQHLLVGFSVFFLTHPIPAHLPSWMHSIPRRPGGASGGARGPWLSRRRGRGWAGRRRWWVLDGSCWWAGTGRRPPAVVGMGVVWAVGRDRCGAPLLDPRDMRFPRAPRHGRPRRRRREPRSAPARCSPLRRRVGGWWGRTTLARGPLAPCAAGRGASSVVEPTRAPPVPGARRQMVFQGTHRRRSTPVVPCFMRRLPKALRIQRSRAMIQLVGGRAVGGARAAGSGFFGRVTNISGCERRARTSVGARARAAGGRQAPACALPPGTHARALACSTPPPRAGGTSPTAWWSSMPMGCIVDRG